MKVVPIKDVDTKRIKALWKKLAELRRAENDQWDEIQACTTQLGVDYGVERPMFSSDYQYLVEGPKNL